MRVHIPVPRASKLAHPRLPHRSAQLEAFESFQRFRSEARLHLLASAHVGHKGDSLTVRRGPLFCVSRYAHAHVLACGRCVSPQRFALQPFTFPGGVLCLLAGEVGHCTQCIRACISQVKCSHTPAFPLSLEHTCSVCDLHSFPPVDEHGDMRVRYNGSFRAFESSAWPAQPTS